MSGTTSDVITIDIMPVVRKTRRYAVIARRGDDVLAEHSATEGYSAIPGILRKLDALGVSHDAGIDFYRGTTLVFLRRTLMDWLGDYREKKNLSEEEED
jgi:hypothetical protein